MRSGIMSLTLLLSSRRWHLNGMININQVHRTMITMNHQDHLSTLPSGIFYEILSWLDIVSISRFGIMNHFYRYISRAALSNIFYLGSSPLIIDLEKFKVWCLYRIHDAVVLPTLTSMNFDNVIIRSAFKEIMKLVPYIKNGKYIIEYRQFSIDLQELSFMCEQYMDRYPKADICIKYVINSPDGQLLILIEYVNDFLHILFNREPGLGIKIFIGLIDRVGMITADIGNRLLDINDGTYSVAKILSKMEDVNISTLIRHRIQSLELNIVTINSLAELALVSAYINDGQSITIKKIRCRSFGGTAIIDQLMYSSNSTTVDIFINMFPTLLIEIVSYEQDTGNEHLIAPNNYIVSRRWEKHIKITRLRM